MKKIIALIVCFCLIAGLMPTTFAQEQIAFYVDPQRGSDSNDGSQGAPFATVQKAQSAVREINKDMSGDIVVYLKGGEYNFAACNISRQIEYFNKDKSVAGTYPVKTGLQFSQEDSGSNGHYVVYRAYGEETPVFTSAKYISGWTLHDAEKNIYKANVGKGTAARQFYVDGVRGIRARTQSLPAGLEFVKEFGFTTTDTSLAELKNQDKIEAVMQSHWCNHRALVSSITEQGGKAAIAMQDPAWSQVIDSGQPSINNASQVKYFENAYEFLDCDGEWYLDETEGTIYYKPRVGQNMANVQAVIPMVDELVYIKGESQDNPAHHIRFEGIAFEYTTWMRPSVAGYHINQNNTIREENSRMPEAAFTAETTNNISLIGCDFRHLGSTAVQFINGVRDVQIEGNTVIDIAGNGIGVESANYSNSDAVAENPGNLFNNTVVSNNYLQDVGMDYRSGFAIGLGIGQNITVSHNEIINTPYAGINAGWHTGGESIVKNIVISNNYIADIEPDGMYDNGAIYTLGDTAGSKEVPGYHVKENYIKNQMNGQAPLYADNTSSWWLAEGNVIDLSDSPQWEKWGTTEPQDPVWFYTQNSTPLGHDNTFRNNYTTTDRYTDNTQSSITGNKVYRNADWPKEAQAIIARSGLESQYESIRPVQNLVQNAGFQFRQTNIWRTKNASFEQVNTENVRGTQAGKVSVKKGGGSLSQTVSVEKGKEYTASVWVKGAQGEKVQLKAGDAVVDSETLAQDGWIQLSGKTTAAKDNVAFAVEFTAERDQTEFYLDEFFVGEVAEEPAPSPEPSATTEPSAEPTVTPGTKTFEDIQNHWAREDIELMAGKGIIEGVDETHYAPEANITRAEFMALIVRVLGVDEVKYRSSFWDVPTASWYANIIQTAVDNNLVDSAMIDGMFIMPEQKITREEMTSLIVKAYELKTESVAPDTSVEHFADRGEISDWAVGYVQGAYGLEIIKGITETEFEPKALATRAQSATMIRRLYDVVN